MITMEMQKLNNYKNNSINKDWAIVIIVRYTAENVNYQPK